MRAKFEIQESANVMNTSTSTSVRRYGQNAVAYLLIAAAIPLLWWVSPAGDQFTFSPMPFLFFHGAIEMASVTIAMLIFVTGYRAILSARENAVVLLGIAFLGVGLLDYVHILSYAGMPDAITENNAHKSMFFWIVARLLASCALLAYASWPLAGAVSAAQRRWALSGILLFVTATSVLGLVLPESIPALFVAGQGLTPLKVGLEWLVCIFNVLTVVVLLARRTSLAHERLPSLIFAAALLSISAIFFTKISVIDTDGANVLGHLYKLAGYLYLFNATFSEALRRPLDLLEVQYRRETVILDAAPDGVLWVDDTGTILSANAAIESLSGYRPQELIGRNVDIFLPPHLHSRHADAVRSYFQAPRARAMGLIDLKLRCRDGGMRPVDISLGCFHDGGRDFTIAYIRDLTERKQYEESLRHQATHDELTGLPNRWLFRFQLDQSIARASRSGLAVAVIFVDLDYFKAVNDSFGHRAGDELLVQVGIRIGEVLRENDMLARLGGDEFGVSISDLRGPQEALHIAGKIIAALQSAFRIAGHELHSGASLGLAFYPSDATDSDTLLRYADMAMYAAKQAGRGNYACYSQEMDGRAHDDMLIHARLKDAVTHGRLELHYQPQVDVKTGLVVGVEALSRWNDPELGTVPPERFIAVAEATGLILPLSDWVLQTACRDIARWSMAGTPIRVSVNFSAQQFRQGGVEQVVEAALQRAGAQAQWLCIEITESVAMVHPELARTQLLRLRAKGCSISLDDFGTGYSSLAYLKSLPITQLKIDRSFMLGIPDNTYDVAIARAILTLAHSLGMTLIAEGVESEQQLQFLRDHGCEVFQGWLFAPALPTRQVDSYLAQRSPTLPEKAASGSDAPL